MKFLGDILNEFIDEYRAADKLQRKVKQALAAIEVIKWNFLIDEMSLIDKEVSE